MLSDKDKKIENSAIIVQKKFSKKTYRGEVSAYHKPDAQMNQNSGGQVVSVGDDHPVENPVQQKGSLNAMDSNILTLEKVEKDSYVYFDGFLDFDDILEHWSKRFYMFITQAERNCQFNLWSGASLTGKTALVKRFAGLDNTKPFSFLKSRFLYYDCYRVKDNFDQLKSEWIDSMTTPANTVIVIDEFEKLVDPSFKLVDEIFAKKLRKYLEDIQSSQKIMFIFITSLNVDRNTVVSLLDNKLASLTDFSLRFPDWNLPRLTTLILQFVQKRNLRISDKAIAHLALHASRHTKILEVQGVMPALEVELKISGLSEIGEDLMDKILQSRG